MHRSNKVIKKLEEMCHKYREEKEKARQQWMVEDSMSKGKSVVQYRRDART